MIEANISTAQQENLLTLLCFDAEAISVLVDNLKIDYFESAPYRDIAQQAIAYHRKFNKPIDTHLPDVFEHILKGTNTKKANLYGEIIGYLYDSKDTVNREYVLSKLEDFISQQQLKLCIEASVEKLAKGDLKGAERAIAGLKKSQLTTFDPGTKLSDVKKSLAFLSIEDDYILTGIKELDRLGICPCKGELYLFTGEPGVGKSQFFGHILKATAMQKLKGLGISLEMSEKRYTGRLYQSIFGVPKSKAKVVDSPIFEKDDLGRLVSITYKMPHPQKTLADPDIGDYLKKRMMRTKFKDAILIKQFPTGMLTIDGLNAYLDNLETFYNYTPDLITIDYPDLMAISSDNIRTDTGVIYKMLRGIAVMRNIAIVVASQTNRSAEGAFLITRKFLAEDASKVHIADNHVTFNQTLGEYKKGLARLYVDKGRNDRKGDIVIISQNYSMGQFCLNSALMTSDYLDIAGLKAKKKDDPKDVEVTTKRSREK